MGFGKNNVLHRNHFRKDWQRNVKTWFDQAGKKSSRRTARQAKATKSGLRPVDLLRPAVRAPTKRYNIKLRSGRGFTLEELKAAGVKRKEALSIGIAVDFRRRNKSEESLKVNVARLQAYKERLVVFPKSGKPAEVDNITSAAAAFPLPAAFTPEAPRAIAADEKTVDAFQSLRYARSNARLAGIRAERIKKAEEEEAAKKK